MKLTLLDNEITIKIQMYSRYNTTYCLGFWHIKKNAKHDIEHYLNLIPQTLEMLSNVNVAFFYNDDKVLDFFKKHLQTKKFKSYKINIKDLPTYEISNHYLESCIKQDNQYLKSLYPHSTEGNYRRRLEKGLVHFEREYENSGKNSFKDLFSIWTSKLFLIDSIINENPFNTEYFAWADVSISRMNKRRRYWDFMNQVYTPKYIYHYDSVMCYHGKELNISAGFILAHKEKWQELLPKYYTQLDLLKHSNYAHDEETILNHIYNNQLFYKINAKKSMGAKLIKRLNFILHALIDNTYSR